MKKLTIDIEQPQIEINGIVFDLLKSDADIYHDALKMQEEFKGLNAKDTHAVYEACEKAAAYIDAILGKGALKKLSGGKPVGLVKQIQIMSQIAESCQESYSDYIESEYLPDASV